MLLLHTYVRMSGQHVGATELTGKLYYLLLLNECFLAYCVNLGSITAGYSTLIPQVLHCRRMYFIPYHHYLAKLILVHSSDGHIYKLFNIVDGYWIFMNHLADLGFEIDNNWKACCHALIVYILVRWMLKYQIFSYTKGFPFIESNQLIRHWATNSLVDFGHWYSIA